VASAALLLTVVGLIEASCPYGSVTIGPTVGGMCPSNAFVACNCCCGYAYGGPPVIVIPPGGSGAPPIGRRKRQTTGVRWYGGVGSMFFSPMNIEVLTIPYADCMDKDTDCVQRAGYCSDPNYATYMKTNCARTCFFCKDNPGALMAASYKQNFCQDRTNDCSYRRDYCNKDYHRELMTFQCPYTCGRCPAGTTTSSNCVDKSADCPYQLSYCNSNQYYSYMYSNCAKSCKFCTAAVATPAPSTDTEIVVVSTCFDKSTDCPYQLAYCNSNQYYSYMYSNCARSCNFCTAAVATPAPTFPTPAPTVPTPAPTVPTSAPTTSTTMGSTSQSTGTSSTCMDKSTTCASQLNLCNNANYVTLMADQCARSCGKC